MGRNQLLYYVLELESNIKERKLGEEGERSYLGFRFPGRPSRASHLVFRRARAHAHALKRSHTHARTRIFVCLESRDSEEKRINALESEYDALVSQRGISRRLIIKTKGRISTSKSFDLKAKSRIAPKEKGIKFNVKKNPA